MTRKIQIVLLAILCLVGVTVAMAQSLTTGDVNGTVTDPSGAVVPNATITLKSLDTGTTRSANTNGTGFYRFSLLSPGRYSVSSSPKGFEKVEQITSVEVGQDTVVNMKLALARGTETVEVSAEIPVVDTESASSVTGFDAKQVQNIPNPGADLTNVAQLAPGVTMNTSGGYGNFTANGMPATSNLFTVNGENDMDPFFNINNSGATNLTLGMNEIEQATVVTNAYSGQYGQQAGAQVNFITKSGGNNFHGSAKYDWNGRALNANDWFGNNLGSSRPFANNNLWGADFGGPIQKDKTFFYVNTEGLVIVVPNDIHAYVPSQAVQTASLAYLADPANGMTASLPLYTKLYGLYNQGSAGHPLTTNSNDACSYFGIGVGATGDNLGLGGGTPCYNEFEANPSAHSHEWILSARVDHNFGQNDKAYVRYRMDRGLQATYTDAFNPVFDVSSNQPSYDGQMQWTHIFSSSATNQLNVTGSYYSAIFNTTNEAGALSTLPVSIYSGPGNGYAGPTQLSYTFDFPQGRNVTQYQIFDDFAKMSGNHSLKFGVNFRRYDVTDHTFTYVNPAVFVLSDLDFFQGVADQYRQKFANLGTSAPIGMYGLGLYAEDGWRVSSKLRLTLSLRAEHNSNPVCQDNCFTLLNGSFNQQLAAGYNTTTPYNTMLQTGLNRAYRSTDAVNWSPRVGFNWSPFGEDKTVISGGFGIFYDAMSQGIIEGAFLNQPNVYYTRVAGVPWADGSAASMVSAGNQLQLAGFNSGASFATIKAADPSFRAATVTNFSGAFHTPQYQEWNLQLQQAIGGNSSIIFNYAGNHGIHIPIDNGVANAYNAGAVPGFPTAAPNKAFGLVEDWSTVGLSNSNSLTTSFTHRFSKGLSFQANYTWAHAMDEVSNGGAFVYGTESLVTQLNPTCLRCNNYGNSDYDIRHNFNANFVWETPWKNSNKVLNGFMAGWTLSSAIFIRSGLPYTVVDGNTILSNGQNPYGYLAQPLAGAAGSCSNGLSQCYNPADFASSYSVFPTQTRNQFRGPDFWNVNMTALKGFKLTERLNMQVGANFYNLFNHANFDLPDNNLGDGTAGQILQTVATPASPYGSFVGAAASPRLIQLEARLKF